MVQMAPGGRAFMSVMFQKSLLTGKRVGCAALLIVAAQVKMAAVTYGADSELLLRDAIEPYQLSVQRVEIPAGAMVAAHGHTSHEILYVLENTITLRVGQSTHRLETGDIFRIRPGMVSSVTNPSGTKPSRILVFYLEKP